MEHLGALAPSLLPHSLGWVSVRNWHCRDHRAHMEHRAAQRRSGSSGAELGWGSAECSRTAPPRARTACFSHSSLMYGLIYFLKQIGRLNFIFCNLVSYVNSKSKKQ